MIISVLSRRSRVARSSRSLRNAPRTPLGREEPRLLRLSPQPCPEVPGTVSNSQACGGRHLAGPRSGAEEVDAGDLG